MAIGGAGDYLATVADLSYGLGGAASRMGLAETGGPGKVAGSTSGG